MTNRWWLYQKERFPLKAYVPLVGTFCLSVLTFSSLQQDPPSWPALTTTIGAIISALLLFFQLRVADEIKDFETDCQYRPERPVPRGLIRLGELTLGARIAAAVQYLIAISVDIGLVPLLCLTWTYMALMKHEFFVATWLRRHPAAYLLSHMLVMPAIAFYVAAFEWLDGGGRMPKGMALLLVLTFCCGLVLELGRKIKAREHERRGVETYSAIWGAGRALVVWQTAVLAASVAYVGAAATISPNGLNLTVAIAVLIVAGGAAHVFTRRDALRRKAGDRVIESGSAIVALSLYLGLGPLQALL